MAKSVDCKCIQNQFTCKLCLSGGSIITNPEEKCNNENCEVEHYD